MNLSEHFTLEEFTHSDTAARLGINNTPDGAMLERLKHTAEQLEAVRTLLGHPIQVTSAYRSVALNAAVPGSSNTSAHTLGYAVDLKCPAFGSPLDVCRAIAASGIKFDQIIHEYGSWCHVSFDPKLRGQTLTKLTGQPYTQGLHA